MMRFAIRRLGQGLFTLVGLSLVSFLLVVAVGSNYALFFDLLRESGDADDDTLASLLLANLTTVASFGLLALSSIPVLAAIGLVVGLWDGFIGPGTGTFFVLALVSVIGHDFLASTALAKLANLTTNASAIVAFAITGNILWGLGLAMGVANLTGGYLGARTALTRGNAFIRKVFLLVVGALAIKLAWDTFFTYWG
mgnify:CR=1 FL=1